MHKYAFLFLFAGIFLAGCDSVDSTPGAALVMVNFETQHSASKNTSKSGSAFESSLMISQSNGTLELTGIRLIVAELELDQSGDDCETTEGEDESCDSFEVGPFFVDLPLDNSAVTAAASEVALGSYKELEFEVENLESDSDDDSQKEQQIEALLNEIRTDGAYSEWPDAASMGVVGTFTPAGSAEAVPFKVYFDAEIEVEIEFATALTISEEGVGPGISVQVNPEAWFVTAKGVRDLSQHNYVAAEENLVSFEVEIEKGFGSVEIEYEFGSDD